MKIGLLDIDGHNFPNLALMKLSAWHKKQGDQVEFVNFLDKYDAVYASKIFTFTPDNYTHIRTSIYKQGGSGYDLKAQLPEHIEHIYPDYRLYRVKEAYGFLTRGCFRNCHFCIVPKKEGGIKDHTDITEFWSTQKVAILMDNNVLASEFGKFQIEKIIRLGIKIDFNQGLDARFIDNETAKLLSRVKWYKPIRMACDSKEQLSSVLRATELLRKYDATPSRYFVYVLVQDVQDSLYIVNELRKHRLDPFAQPLITETVFPTVEQKKFARWVNRKQLRNVEWKDYKYA